MTRQWLLGGVDVATLSWCLEAHLFDWSRCCFGGIASAGAHDDAAVDWEDGLLPGEGSDICSVVSITSLNKWRLSAYDLERMRCLCL